MLLIGLTGGIASGKTLVSDFFTALGVPVIDADILAREVVAPGSEGLKKLTDYCLLYTSPSPRDLSTSRMPSSA